MDQFAGTSYYSYLCALPKQPVQHVTAPKAQNSSLPGALRAKQCKHSTQCESGRANFLDFAGHVLFRPFRKITRLMVAIFVFGLAAIHAQAHDTTARCALIAKNMKQPHGLVDGIATRAGDTAMIRAQGLLRLCNGKASFAAAMGYLSNLTPTQRRKVGSNVGVWFAALALPLIPLASVRMIGGAINMALRSTLRSLQLSAMTKSAATAAGGASAAAASRVTQKGAIATTAAIGGAARAVLQATKARTVSAAAATTAVTRNAGFSQRHFLVFELTRRSGVKRSLDVPLPRVLNPTVSRVLERFPQLAY